MKTQHARAIELLSLPEDRGTEGDRSWLREHLQACPPCRAAQAALSALGEAVRNHPAGAPAATVTRTKAAVRRRIVERDEEAASERDALLGVACATILTAACATVAWWAVAWLGRLTGLPPSACRLAYASLWMLWSYAAVGVALGARLSPLGSVSGIEGGRR